MDANAPDSGAERPLAALVRTQLNCDGELHLDRTFTTLLLQMIDSLERETALGKHFLFELNQILNNKLQR